MGRPPWASPEQIEFLTGYSLDLDGQKEHQGLTAHYDRVADRFMEKWPTIPTNEERQRVASEGGDLQVIANTRRKRVSLFPTSPPWLGVDPVYCQQIHQWFKTFRRNRDRPSQPKTVLNLTGKITRKVAPHQFHHAYSIQFYRPDNSQLRQEVDELWSRREEQSVIDMLAPFMTQGGAANPNKILNFHNAVMRWKCSLLTDEEREAHHDWIEEDARQRAEEAEKPWKAEGCSSELAAENEFIQRYALLSPLEGRHKLIQLSSCIDALPVTVDQVLGEIEKMTGMKAILLLGGPTPAEHGEITTHW